MRATYERILALAGVLLVALAVSNGSTELLVGVAAVAIAIALATKATVITGERQITVGSRANAHRESLSNQPEPSSPSTPGRPLRRAPAQSIAVA
jgi:hypothetical protein